MIKNNKLNQIDSNKIRIEDMILITDDGCEVLTESITKKRE